MKADQDVKNSEKRHRPVRLCIIINPPIGLHNFYRKQFYYLMEKGYEITGVSGVGPEHEIVRKMGVKTHVVPMERLPSPIKDFVSLIRLWWFLLWHRFDIVHVSTPKAGLLGALAARLTGHRRVVYTIRGRPYEHMTGLKRKIMNACEWMTSALARRVIPVCHELGRKVVEEGLCRPVKIRTIGLGSSNGVDIDRFERTDERMQAGKEFRKELGITERNVLILFVGWLRRDKGANELVRAFKGLAEERPESHLMMMGKYWSADPLDADVRQLIEQHPRIHHVPWRRDPVPVYAAADMVVLPSYREGFPNVVLEGSASRLPVIATDIMGCREAVEDGVTGLLVERANPEALTQAIKRLIDDPALRVELGRNGRRRVEREFRQERIWEGIVKQYEELLNRTIPG